MIQIPDKVRGWMAANAGIVIFLMVMFGITWILLLLSNLDVIS